MLLHLENLKYIEVQIRIILIYFQIRIGVNYMTCGTKKQNKQYQDDHLYTL